MPCVFHRLIHPHLRLTQLAPRPVFRGVRIGVHGQLHQEKGQGLVPEILAPPGNEHRQQCTIGVGSDLVVSP